MRANNKEAGFRDNLLAGVICFILLACGLAWCKSHEKSDTVPVAAIGEKLEISAESWAFSDDAALKKAARLAAKDKKAAEVFFKAEMRAGRAFYVMPGMQVIVLDSSVLGETVQVQTSTGSRGWIAADVAKPE